MASPRRPTQAPAVRHCRNRFAEILQRFCRDFAEIYDFNMFSTEIHFAEILQRFCRDFAEILPRFCFAGGCLKDSLRNGSEAVAGLGFLLVFKTGF